MKQDNINFFFQTLKKQYPDANTELNRDTPYQLLISVILSAQTTDKQVNKVTENLFKTIQSPQDTIDTGLDKLQNMIKSIGLYKGKAKNIYHTSQTLCDEEYQNTILNTTKEQNVKTLYTKHGYVIPQSIRELQKLNGVGEKTAKVVSHVLYNTPVIAVDTHVHRVTNRIGLVNTKTPNQTSKILETVVPDRYKKAAHHGLILFGRYHCKARKPACESCPFTDFCKYYSKQKNTKTTK